MSRRAWLVLYVLGWAVVAYLMAGPDWSEVNVRYQREHFGTGRYLR